MDINDLKIKLQYNIHNITKLESNLKTIWSDGLAVIAGGPPSSGRSAADASSQRRMTHMTEPATSEDEPRTGAACITAST